MPAEKHLQNLFGLYGDVRSPQRLAADPESLTSYYGRFSAPLIEVGLGKIIGNLLRGALLTCLEGPAITAVKIEGVEHEFSYVPQVLEDATEIIHSLQAIPFNLHTSEHRTLKISKDGPGEVTSADIELDADIEVLDHTVHIATVSEGGRFNVEMRLKRGRGYVSADRNLDEDLEPGYIPIDSVHTPVKKVNCTLEPAQRGGNTYHKLSMDIWTNGSVTPQAALGVAANLIEHLMSVFINFDETTDKDQQLDTQEDNSGRTTFDTYRVAHHGRDAMRMPRLDPRAYGSMRDVKSPEDMFQEVAARFQETFSVDLIPTVREVIQEESTARNYVTNRYRSLIDRKYVSGLSASEIEELDALRLTLEEMDKPYYEAIITRLHSLIEQNQS